MTVTPEAITAMADATHAATHFGRRLYPENVICTNDESLSEAVRRGLDDGDEKWPADMAIAHTHVVFLATGRVEPVAPDRRRTAVDALVRLLGARLAACDRCHRGVAPIAGLLPVGAGAAVVVLALCPPCCSSLPASAHLLTNTEN